jgi:23S rRNA (pseudouridine1915-N3)-methyltransferase
MKIIIAAMGKTDAEWVQENIGEYLRRLRKYADCEFKAFPDIKNAGQLSAAQRMQKEGQVFMEFFLPGDYVVLMDEQGKQYNSEGFAKQIQIWQNNSIKRLIFVIGGAYGFSQEIYQRGQSKISLSAMTFNHQMVRIILLEQIYRAFTILKGEPYHHK